MLLSLSVRNFRCFRHEVVLDLAPSLRTRRPSGGFTWSDVVVRNAAVFGANASGKTTLLEALYALSAAVRNPGWNSVFQPSLSARPGEEEHTVFRVSYVGPDEVRYDYDVQAASWGIAFEQLSAFPKGVRRVLFTRSQAGADAAVEVIGGSSLTGPTAEVARITRPTMLYLATARRFGHSGLLAAANGLVGDAGITKLDLRLRMADNVLQRVIMEMVNAPEAHTDLMAALLRAADLGITGVEVRQERIPEQVREEIRRFLAAAADTGEVDEDSVPQLRDVVMFRHRGRDGDSFELSSEWESAGTVTWLTTAWHVLQTLRRGGVLVVDEIDASLHPALTRYIVELFSSRELNPRGGQLIFSTHDVSLLGNAPTKVLEPSSVWFTEKSSEGDSDLYSLADFDNRRGNNNERRYMAGQFGAVPKIDESMLLDFICPDSEVA